MIHFEYRDRRIRWRHLSAISDTTTVGGANLLGTRNLVCLRIFV